ncbi:MAG: enoyl-CoA hydratase/isomerase family protein [Pseudomonadota bacterium]
MEDQVLRVTVDRRGVARLTMNRPTVRNAFDEELIGALCDAMGAIAGDSGVRVVVLTGAGGAFCAGADLNMMRRAASFSDNENKDDARRLAHMLRAIYDSPKPVIARVNGPALGGGVGVVCACDVAVAVEESFFALSEVRLGLVPAVISPFVVRAMGPRPARRYFLTAERFDAEEAKRLGVVHKVVMGAQLDDAVDETVEKMLLAGPHALSASKDLIRRVAYEPITDGVMEETAGLIAGIRASDEGKEGVGAFLEKRPPAWINAGAEDDAGSS